MTGYVTRRHAVALLAAASCLVAGASAQAQNSIKIGYAISKTGPNTGGASITTLPNYQLWVKDVNAAGGIMLSGKRVPVEIVEYDDRSNSEEAVKAVERLATQDKVDFILLALGHRAQPRRRADHEPPRLSASRSHDQDRPGAGAGQELANASFWLGLPSDISTSFVDVLTKMKGEGKIGANVAMIGVSDQFGIELSTAARNALKKAGFNLVYDKSYPAGTQDVQPLLKDAMAANPDTFIAFSYPPDTLGVTDTAKVLNFNPKVFFVGVGTAFPVYKQRFGENANGVMGIGGWNADSPALKDYFKRHTEAVGREPDRWASPITYASLQALQQAIEKVGKIDRDAVIKELQTGTFDTIIGKVKLEGGLLKDVWGVGQWQNGEFYGVAPVTKEGARPVIAPKPAWKP